MAHRRGTARDHQLAGDEVVVGDGVGGEVTQVAKAEGAQTVRGSQVVDLLAHVPVVAVTPERRVVLGDGGIGGDVAVEKVERVGAEQVGHGGGKLAEIPEHRLTQIDVGARRPGVRRVGKGKKHEPHAREGEREACESHDRPATIRRRTRFRTPLPRRTERSVAATSRAASSTSPCTRSYRVSRSASLSSTRSTPRISLRRTRRPVWANAPASFRTTTIRYCPFSVGGGT